MGLGVKGQLGPLADTHSLGDIDGHCGELKLQSFGKPTLLLEKESFKNAELTKSLHPIQKENLNSPSMYFFFLSAAQNHFETHRLGLFWTCSKCVVT